MGQTRRIFRKPKLVPKGQEQPPRGGPRAWTPTEDVLEKVVEALARRWPKHAIIYMIKVEAGKDMNTTRKHSVDSDVLEPWWEVGRAECERLLGEGRTLMMKKMDLDDKEEKAKGIALYESIIADPKSTNTERTRAQERIDSLLGLDAKFGNRSETAEALAAKLRAAAAAMSGTTAPAEKPPEE